MSNGGDGTAAGAVRARSSNRRTVSPASVAVAASSRSATATAALAVWTTALVLATIVSTDGVGVGALAFAAVAGGSGGGSSAVAATAAGRMAPCAHLGDEINDVSARAFASDVVFEGKVRSRGPVRPGAGTYGVTFVVQRVHKDTMQAVTYEGLRAGSPIRLYFRQKRGSGDKSGGSSRYPQQQPRRPVGRRRADAQCVQRFAPAAGGQPVEANIKRGAKYLVFVAGVGPHNLSVLGEPVLRTPKNLEAVRKVLCRNCSEYLYRLLPDNARLFHSYRHGGEKTGCDSLIYLPKKNTRGCNRHVHGDTFI